MFRIGTSGGGGLGDPFTRDPASVAADVRARRVSEDAARLRYGVALDDSGTGLSPWWLLVAVAAAGGGAALWLRRNRTRPAT